MSEQKEVRTMHVHYCVSTDTGMRIVGKEFSVDLSASDAVRLYWYLQASMPHLAEIIRREARKAEIDRNEAYDTARELNNDASK